MHGARSGRGYAIYRGITTGLNDAFIIDNKTKEELIAKDPKSAEIIKPLVRGRDIQRYNVNWKGLWLIATFPARSLSIDEYPAVRRHLLSFGKARLEQSGRLLSDGTRARKKTGNAWYEMQDTCAYHEEFKKEKLFWIDLTEEGRFAYNTGETYCLNSAYMMTGNSIKYLCAVLNSTLITWFMRNSALNSGMGVSRWVRFTVDRIPVPKIGSSREQRFIQLVDKLQVAYGSGTNTADIEATADSLVYELYGLTDEEVSAVARE